MARIVVGMEINKEGFEALVDTRALLLDYIRDVANLTGTKRGCNEGKCGACTVVLDGHAVKSCNMFAASAEGCKVETVESLGSMERMHPLQEAFHKNHGLQCGYCTAGFLMTAKYLLENGLSSDHDEIREAVHGNICRCTGYQKIIESIAEVATSKRLLGEKAQPAAAPVD